MIRSAIFVLFVLVVRFAAAHDLDLTLIKMDQGRGKSTLELTTPLSRFVQTSNLSDQPSAPALDMAVRERLKLGTNFPASININSQADLLTWSAVLSPGQELSLDRFDQSTPDARTVIAKYENGKLQSETLLEGEQTLPSTFGMFCTGVQHIFSGLDHILFIVGLALLGGGFKSILKVLTAFTVAHSVTLFAASAGWVRANPRFIEPLIALSIVALAIEGIRRINQDEVPSIRPRIAIAFVFGLIHGFGFGGGLTDLGLQGAQLLKSIFYFSLGIEFGQFLILVPTALLLLALAKADKQRAKQFALSASVGLGMIGCFWFMERVL